MLKSCSESKGGLLNTPRGVVYETLPSEAEAVGDAQQLKAAGHWSLAISEVKKRKGES